MSRTITAVLFVCALGASICATAQTSPNRQRAQPIYREAWNHMRAEAWLDAAKGFQQAIDMDAEFEDAYYGLGRANMGLRKFAEASAAYEKCQQLYRAESGRQFANRQEAQRYRQDRITEIDELIRQAQSGPQTFQSQDRLRQLQEQRRLIQQNMSRGEDVSLGSTVPAFVPLALGSAYLRGERFADAEREYKVALKIDPKTGEAWSNLAVLYLTTKRYPEAETAVTNAEKAGFKVHPGLKDEIKKKKAGG